MSEPTSTLSPSAIIFQSVIVPSLPDGWSSQKTNLLGWASKDRASDLDKHTYFGEVLFKKELFDFRRFRVLKNKALPALRLDPNIGDVWLSTKAQVDERTGRFFHVVDASNQAGACAYYLRRKQEMPDFVNNQYADALDKAGNVSRDLLSLLGQALPEDFKGTVIRVLSAPPDKCQHTFPVEARRVSEDEEADDYHSALPLASTCRLLRDKVKSLHLKDLGPDTQHNQ